MIDRLSVAKQINNMHESLVDILLENEFTEQQKKLIINISTHMIKFVESLMDEDT